MAMAYLCHRFFFVLKKKMAMAYRRHRPEFLWNVQFQTRMPLGYAIQDGDCPHSKQRLPRGRGVKEALTRHVRENHRRNEVLDFVSRDFSNYAWTLRTLDRRLQYFGISYADRTVQIDEVE